MGLLKFLRVGIYWVSFMKDAIFIFSSFFFTTKDSNGTLRLALNDYFLCDTKIE